MSEFVTRIVNYLEELGDEVYHHTDTYVTIGPNTTMGTISTILNKLELDGFKVKYHFQYDSPTFVIYEED